MRITLRLGLAIAVGALSMGCGKSEEHYQPAPAWTGRKPSLPTPPPLDPTPTKVGDAYTVAGASHHLRSRVHEKEVTLKPIIIQGYIVAENITDAPACAIHKVGKKDPDDCTTEIPSFYIADDKGAGPEKPRIRVLGWARDFAVVHDAMEKYRNVKEVKDPKDLFKDDLWDVAVPFPLPAVGAKVKVTGKYGFTSTKSSTGIVSDPVNGVMTSDKVETLEAAPQKVTFKNSPVR
jgi:hypothetical protein